MADQPQSVTLVMTVLNDAAGCRAVLDSLSEQKRRPDEIILVDGGSTDATLSLIRERAAEDPRVRLVHADGCNIAAGRNIGIRAATNSIIATTDAGCGLDPDWLERLVAPFAQGPRVDVVAGFYRVDARSTLERVIGLATMRGQLDPVDPASFNPSARSMAFRKRVWQRAGGFPDWLYTSEDTLFDLKLRRMNARWAFAGDAVVHWRPRSSVKTLARQFYLYGRGRGHTQIEAADYNYNLRHLALLGLLLIAGFAHPGAWLLFAAAAFYCLIWRFHTPARRIASATRSTPDYFVALVVYLTVMFAGTAGYVVGTLQRRRNTAVFRDRMNAYLTVGESG